MSSSVARIAPLEYRHVDIAAPAALTSSAPEEPPNLEPEPQVEGIAEKEFERRVQRVHDAALAEAEGRVRDESERVRLDAQQRLSETLRRFEQERQAYFRSVEREIVQLSLAIARKILEREAQMEPTLLAALVRIALDRMQCGASVRVRVAPLEAKDWEQWGEEKAGGSRWAVVPDSALEPGDCVVETDMGSASFGFEAQLRDVEESFLQLLAHRPAA